MALQVLLNNPPSQIPIFFDVPRIPIRILIKRALQALFTNPLSQIPLFFDVQRIPLRIFMKFYLTTPYHKFLFSLMCKGSRLESWWNGLFKFYLPTPYRKFLSSLMCKESRFEFSWSFIYQPPIANSSFLWCATDPDSNYTKRVAHFSFHNPYT